MYVYKYSTPEIGKKLYELYIAKEIHNEDEFLEKYRSLERGEQNGR